MDATGTPGTEEMDQAEVRSVVEQLLIEGFARVMLADEFLKAQ